MEVLIQVLTGLFLFFNFFDLLLMSFELSFHHM